MEYRFLGNSGLKVSSLSLGAWVTFGGQIDLNHSYEIMKTAYEQGINFFDNAEVYANGNAETVMGEVIKKAGWKRSDLVLSTKYFGEAKDQTIGACRENTLSKAHMQH
jgi:aryl-alcohol dehydrogenase-like predicted oxidoreductase